MATILFQGVALFLTLVFTHFSSSLVEATRLGSCPNFDGGKWAVGELLPHVNSLKQISKLDIKYIDRTPRACCDACTRLSTCEYWTWLGATRGASLGNCTLFRDFACEADASGKLPIDLDNRNARTGSNVCSRPETRDTSGTVSLESIREAAIAEVKSHLNAEIAVGEAEIARLKAEEQAILRSEAEAEAEAAEEEQLLAEAKLAEAQAAAELAKAKAKEAKALAALKAAQEAEAAAKAKLAEEEAQAAKILADESKVEGQIKAAKAAKASADEVLAMQMMINDKDRQAKDLKDPYHACPAKIEKGQWAVGTLRNLLGTSGNYSKISDVLDNVTPGICCQTCGTTAGCVYWSWLGGQKGSVKGDCTFFNGLGCSPGTYGNLPFEKKDKLGRVGKSCGVSSNS